MEKVIVAQERMANNFVYLFQQKKESKFSWCAEIRSYLDRSNDRYSGVRKFKIMMRKKRKDDTGQTLVCQIPNIIYDIPVIILFRALGFVSDREILQYICYDKSDK